LTRAFAVIPSESADPTFFDGLIRRHRCCRRPAKGNAVADRMRAQRCDGPQVSAKLLVREENTRGGVEMSKNKLTMFWMGVGAVALACLASRSAHADEVTAAPPTAAEVPAAPAAATEAAKSAEGEDVAARYIGLTLMAASAGQALVMLPSGCEPLPGEPPPGPLSAGPARTFALVDQALVPQVFTLLPSGTRSSVVAIPGPQRDVVRSVMPVLIELPDEGAPREAVARLSMHWAREHHAATWLLSRLSIEALAAALSRLMSVRLADDVRLEGQSDGRRSALLRLADSRVLAAAPGILRHDQLQMLLSVAPQWRYLDRNEVLRTLGSPAVKVDDAVGEKAGDEGAATDSPEESLPLVMEATQVASFRAASLPDEVFRIANATSSGGLNGLAGPVRHAYVLDQIRKAQSLGMATSQEIGLYTSIALRKGEDFFSGDRWRGAEAQARAGRMSWMEVLTSGDLWP
jgi:hypothetical protein